MVEITKQVKDRLNGKAGRAASSTSTRASAAEEHTLVHLYHLSMQEKMLDHGFEWELSMTSIQGLAQTRSRPLGSSLGLALTTAHNELIQMDSDALDPTTWATRH